MRRAMLGLAIGCLLFSGAANAHDGRPRFVSGPFAAHTGSDSVSVARSALATTLAGGEAELAHARTTRVAGRDRVVRFQQLHRGVPVAFRGASVVLQGNGAPLYAVTRVEAVLPDTTPAIDASVAADAAGRALGSATTGSDARLAIVPVNGAATLAYVVYPSARSLGIPWAPVVLVDARSARLLGGWNAAVSAGAAKVYPANPVASPNLVDVVLPVGAGVTTLENERVKSLNCIDTKQVKPVNFMGLNFNAHVCDLLQTATADVNGDFPQAPGGDTEPEDAFSELSMFYHVNQGYAFFQALGMSDLDTKPLPTISNLRLPDGYQSTDLAKMANPNLPLVPFQNAFFAPANPIFSSIFGLPGSAMWFGQGPLRDYSYDGDVVYHEFTHAVVDHTLKLVGNWHADAQGLVDSPGAMNEALADFFAAVITGDSKMGEYAAKDLAPGLTAIRDLSNDLTCPANLSGEVHSDSQFWSAGLWKARSALAPAARSKFDQALFDVMAAAPGGDLGFEDLSELFVESVKAEIDQTAADALSQELKQRGALPACQRVREWAGQPLSGTDKFMSNALIAPGLRSALGSLPYAPGVLQFHVAVPAATTLNVQFTQVKVSSSSNLPFLQGTPFAPKLLVRWGDEPIRFSYDPDFAATSDALVDVSLASNTGTAVLEVPAGTTSAYVMIVNAGDQDGGYKSLAFEFSGTPDAGPADGGDDAGTDAGTGGSAAKKADSGGDDGCGCRAAGSARSGWTLALGALALGALVGRRRRMRG